MYICVLYIFHFSKKTASWKCLHATFISSLYMPFLMSIPLLQRFRPSCSWSFSGEVSRVLSYKGRKWWGGAGSQGVFTFRSLWYSVCLLEIAVVKVIKRVIPMAMFQPWISWPGQPVSLNFRTSHILELRHGFLIAYEAEFNLHPHKVAKQGYLDARELLFQVFFNKCYCEGIINNYSPHGLRRTQGEGDS